MSGLTRRQKDVLNVIRNTVAERGTVPSIEEIGDAVGLSSASSVHHQLKTLEEKGFILRDPGRSRSIRLADGEGRPELAGAVVAVPIIGEIAAGEPIHAYEDYQQSLLLARDLIRTDEAFILRVRGKSMIEDLIDDGDMVVVRKQETADDGDIVVALLPDDGATLKRLYREKAGFRLQPANSTMKPIYTPDVRIQGKVIALLRVHEQKAVSYR